MKILCVILIGMFLSGCAITYDKLTTLRIKGKKIRVPIGSIAPVEGEDVQATLTREVHLTNVKKRKVPPLSDVNLQEDSNEKGSVGVKK